VVWYPDAGFSLVPDTTNTNTATGFSLHPDTTPP